MNTFSKKQINTPERVCVRLKSLREERGLSIADMISRTKLSRDNIIAIESCNFHKLPEGAVYRTCFIRRYTRALGVDAGPFIKQFKIEEARDVQTPVHTHDPSVTHLQALQNIPGLLRTALIGICMLAFVGYLGLQLHQLLEPPMLVLNSPTNGIVSEDSVVVVSGQTEPEVSVQINGEYIMSANGGTFKTNIDLQPGLNTIVVTAEKKHRKTSNITRHIIYKEPFAFDNTSTIQN